MTSTPGISLFTRMMTLVFAHVCHHLRLAWWSPEQIAFLYSICVLWVRALSPSLVPATSPSAALFLFLPCCCCYCCCKSRPPISTAPDSVVPLFLRQKGPLVRSTEDIEAGSLARALWLPFTRWTEFEKSSCFFVERFWYDQTSSTARQKVVESLPRC